MVTGETGNNCSMTTEEGIGEEDEGEGGFEEGGASIGKTLWAVVSGG
jgi:hypothetical protein